MISQSNVRPLQKTFMLNPDNLFSKITMEDGM